MPTYEYECDGCGHAFERLQRMSDAAVRKCPKCSKLKVRRLISGGAGVIFKGSGFYETDYRRKRGGGASGADRDAAESAAPAAPKSDAPAPKPEPKGESKDDAKPGPKHRSHDAGRSSGKPHGKPGAGKD